MFKNIILCFACLLIFSCSKEVIEKVKEKAPAETLTFQKVSKAFTSGGKFTTADILGGVQGTKSGYTIKSITTLNPHNLVTVSATKELNFSGSAGTFTATIVLQHKDKKDATITGAQFEITKVTAETLTFQKVSKAFTSGGKFTTAEILGGVQGSKSGYTIKNITALNPNNLVTVSATKELNFSGSAGTFTATIVLEHPEKANATITGAQFEIRSLPAESLTFQKVSKAFTSGGKFTTAEILGGVQGTKSGYTIKSITALNPNNLVTVSATKELNFSGSAGTFTATIVLEHPAKADATITGAQFELHSGNLLRINILGRLVLKLSVNKKNITTLFIPETLNGTAITIIGVSAFNDCTSLTSITLPNSLTTIKDGAFLNCTSLTTITIPNSVTTIGNQAFSNCTSLTTITIPNSVTTIGNQAFLNCTSLTSITISNSVTSIGESAFSRCEKLTSITIPNSVTSIGESAFSRCRALTSITLSNSLTSIGDATFFDCSALTSITIPISVTSIGDDVFNFCNSLTTIRVPTAKKSAWETKLKKHNSATVVGY